MRKCLPLCTCGCQLATSIWLKKFHDHERIPRKGGLIYVCNHSSLLDGVLLTSRLSWLRFSPTHTIAYKEPFENKFFGYILRSGRCIPFDRKDKDSIELMLRKALGYLKNGETVALFPEGHLNDGKSLRLPRPGAALLALESGAPVLPLGLRGTREAVPPGGKITFGRKASIHTGRLIDTSAMSRDYHNSDRAGRARLVQELSLQMMRQISELSGQALHRRMR